MRKKKGSKTIAEHPELLRQWHPTRNGHLDPARIADGSNENFWWKCPKGPDHEWRAAGNNRLRGTGCPCCSGRKVCADNCLATVAPALAAEWHPTKNRTVTPRDVVAGSAKKVWWKCSEGVDHEWQATCDKRRKGTQCPCCAGQKVSVTNSLESLHPELLPEWHPSKNGDRTPSQVVARSSKKHWWKCARGPDHEWQASAVKRVTGRGCPFCRGLRVSVTNSFALHFPELLKQWHPTRNGSLEPETLVWGSHQRVWWKCAGGVDHEWATSLKERTQRPKQCPFCCKQKVSITNSLVTCHPAIAAQWHPTKNGAMTPDQVISGSGRSYWWKCSKGPDHEWRTSGHRRTQGRGCHFCEGRATSVTNSLAALRPEVAGEWHWEKNEGITPDDVTTGSGRKVWWRCSKHESHEWPASVSSRTRNRGCPRCATGLYERLCRTVFETLFGSEFPSTWPQWLVGPRTRRVLQLDGYSEKLGIAFEHQGEQHFRFIPYFHSTEAKFRAQKSRDRRKRKLCRARGILLIEIPQLDTRIAREELVQFVVDQCRSAGVRISRAAEKRAQQLPLDLTRAH